MKKSKIKAFTLIELIVVITILAILGTIAFISLQGYSTSARNSVRKTDLVLLKKSVELFFIKSSKYPRPDEEINISYSGANLFYQGYVGENIIRNLSNLSKKPVDPLFNIEYSYSVTNNLKNYQLGTLFEDGLYSYNNNLNIGTKVNAISNDNLVSYTLGNYTLFDLVARIANNCINLTIPSININNINSSGVLLSNGNYNFVYNTSSNLPKNYQSIIDNNNPGNSFMIKEVLNKCSIDNLDELNTYINLLSTAYQQFNGNPDFDELIYNSYKIYYKIQLINNLKSNGILVSDGIIEDIYTNSPDNIFSDTFLGNNNDTLVSGHTANTLGIWEFLDPLSNISSYKIFGNQLQKSDSSTGAIIPVPISSITSPNYIISFDINDFAGGQINIYTRYVDEDNYYCLRITQNGYQLIRKVSGVELAFGDVTENIPINSKIEFNIFGNNLVLLINNIEKENIIDNSISDIGKIAIEMLKQNSIIDNFVLKYK